MATTTIIVATSTDQLEAAILIRTTVFVEEQGVPMELEKDAQDRVAVHVLASKGDEAVGCARILRLDETTVKVGRVAVRAEHRGEGIGAEIMTFVEAWARAEGFQSMVLHAQEPVVPFYERLGYQKQSERFFEADIPHFKMGRDL